MIGTFVGGDGDGVLRKEIVGGTPSFVTGFTSVFFSSSLCLLATLTGFFRVAFSCSSLEESELDASDASAAIAAEASAPNGSLIISFDVM